MQVVPVTTWHEGRVISAWGFRERAGGVGSEEHVLVQFSSVQSLSHVRLFGNGNPLQCSCLENPRDGGAWWAAVSGVAQSRTRLKRPSCIKM